MSNKRKKRHAEWLKREEKRKAEEKLREEMNSGDIEKMAAAMGVRLN